MSTPNNSDYFHRHFHVDINKWMLFVDGENFTIRAQEIAKEKGLDLAKGSYYQPNIFIWPKVMFQTEIIIGGLLKKPPLRSYYYTSLVGDEKQIDYIKRLCLCIWLR